MAKKAKAKTKKTTVCVTRMKPGGGSRKTCSKMTEKQIKKLWAEIGTKGSRIQLLERFF